MDAFRYSAIDTAHRCLTRYKFQYRDKLEIPGKPSIDLEFGTALHAGLNAILEKDDGLLTFEVHWNSVKDTQFASAQKGWEELKELGEIFLSRFQRLHAKHFEPFLMEQKVTGMVGPHQFEGTPDFVGKYKGIPSIVDFKTSAWAYDKEKLLTNSQMPLYAHLVKQKHGYEALQTVYVVFIKREERIQVLTQPLNETLLTNHVNNVKIVADDLVAREQWPKNSNSCMMGPIKCPFFSKCWENK